MTRPAANDADAANSILQKLAIPPASRPAAFGVGIFLLLVLVAVPWLLTAAGRGDIMSALTSVALYSVISSGVWLTFYIGRINIGQGAYALLGGYVSAVLVVKYDMLFWYTLPLAGLFCAAASAFIGLPILRLRGVYFAMVTLTLTEVARLLAQATPITNGPSGITNIPPPGELSLFGLTLIPDFAELENLRLGFYYLAAVLMILCFAGMWRLVNSRLGFLCRSLQQNEELAASIGVNVSRLRLLAYAVSSFLGGIGGAVFAAIVQSVYPATFQIQESVNFMLYCFTGGLNYVFGPMLGTLVLYLGWDFLFKTGEYQLLIYSTALISMMLFLPNGLLSIRPQNFFAKSPRA
ncbi:MAG: branched-chain amino acid ABC transporter permease [Gammaproteobacteria bacterium]